MRLPNSFFAVVTVFSLSVFCSSTVIGDDLTPEQIESIKQQIKSLKENLDGHLSTRNASAGDVFLKASATPRAAMELYLKCVNLVNFQEKGLKEADFRFWKEDEDVAPRLNGKKLPESLQMLLRYLAISCHAAEVDEIEKVFIPLTSYVNSLSQMGELPDRILTESVANSVFAKAYDLKDLLGQNKSWEQAPINISGIYTKTILPHLRKESPEGLMAAWDRRIDQETRLVAYYEKEKGKVMRGKTLKQKSDTRKNLWKKGGDSQMDRMGYNKDKFINETLPNLKWSKLVDLYASVDQVNGAKAMLDFVKNNLNTPLGEKFFQEFQTIITSASEPKETTE